MIAELSQRPLVRLGSPWRWRLSVGVKISYPDAAATVTDQQCQYCSTFSTFSSHGLGHRANVLDHIRHPGQSGEQSKHCRCVQVRSQFLYGKTIFDAFVKRGLIVFAKTSSGS